MKIEKVNDHQIRCTLTGADLADRELKISELAYGTEKAKNLFRDMMQQASFEFGFEAEDIPLMIEAIPVNPDCIVLIITKVEDPEELDTRFAKFSPSVAQNDDEESLSDGDNSGNVSSISDDVMDLFHRIKEKNKSNIAESVIDDQNAAGKKSSSNSCILITDNLDALCRLGKLLSNFYTSKSFLYKEGFTYHLVLTIGDMDRGEFSKICNIASEYGHLEKLSSSREAYIREHSQLLLNENAITSLSQI